MSVEIYRINGHLEETDCDWCGCPLFHGDYAFQAENTQFVYCSRSCHRKHIDREEAAEGGAA